MNSKNNPRSPIKLKNPRGLFDEEYRLEKLTIKKDPLVRLKEEIIGTYFAQL